MLKPQSNMSLQAYNSMAVPSVADCLIEVNNIAQIEQALAYARQQQLPVLVLGEGSNTLFSGDFAGLVVVNRLRGIEVVEETERAVTLRVAAGENWHSFVEHCLERGFYGLENLALIPGSVGAAPMQNIGAYGVEVKDSLVSVDYLELERGDPHTLSVEQCCLGYRDSIFKHSLSGKMIVTAVTFELHKTPSVKLSYPALQAALGGRHTDSQAATQPTPQQVFDAVCELRQAKLPMPKQIPNTGSFFKNPIVSSEQHQALKQRFPGLVSFAVDDQFKLAAAWLIERAGWKAKELDGVRVHHQQALVIVNPNKRSGQTVLKFATQIQEDILNTYQVELEIEPRIYG